MRDYGIDKGLIEFRDDSARNQRGWSKGFFGFRKMFRDYLTKLNVPFFDACCPALTGDIYPVRYNNDDNVLERLNEEGEWEPVLEGSDATFDDIEVNSISADDTFIAVNSPITTDSGIFTSDLEKIVPAIPLNAQNDIPAGTGGAISVSNHMTTINTDAGGDAFTLANGTVVGQTKKIYLLTDGGGSAVITPTTLYGGTTITMDDAGDYVLLIWVGPVGWAVIENIGATVA